MTAVLVISLVGVALALGILVGIVSGHLLLRPGDRRRLVVIARTLLAEQYIENATRHTLQAMRDATRHSRDVG